MSQGISLNEKIISLLMDLQIIEICSFPSTFEASTTSAEVERYKFCKGFHNFFTENTENFGDEGITKVFNNIYNYLLSHSKMCKLSYETQRKFYTIAKSIREAQQPESSTSLVELIKLPDSADDGIKTNISKHNTNIQYEEGIQGARRANKKNNALFMLGIAGSIFLLCIGLTLLLSSVFTGGGGLFGGIALIVFGAVVFAGSFAMLKIESALAPAKMEMSTQITSKGINDDIQILTRALDNGAVERREQEIAAEPQTIVIYDQGKNEIYRHGMVFNKSNLDVRKLATNILAWIKSPPLPSEPSESKEDEDKSVAAAAPEAPKILPPPELGNKVVRKIKYFDGAGQELVMKAYANQDKGKNLGDLSIFRFKLKQKGKVVAAGSLVRQDNGHGDPSFEVGPSSLPSDVSSDMAERIRFSTKKLEPNP